MGDFYFEQRNYQPAFEQYSLALEKHPDSGRNRRKAVVSAVNVGIGFIKTRDYPDALRWMDVALGIDPENPHAMKKAKRRRGRLSEVWEDLMALLRLIGSWVNGSYREVPWESIIWAIAAVIYLLNPFDLIPDFIPVVGFLDDAAVIAWVIKLIKGDLDDFKAWEKTKSDAATDPTTSSPSEADEALPPQE